MLIFLSIQGGVSFEVRIDVPIEMRSSDVLEKYSRERWNELELSDLERADEIVCNSNEQHPSTV